MAALGLVWAIGPGGAMAQSAAQPVASRPPATANSSSDSIPEDGLDDTQTIQLPPNDPWSSPDLVAPRLDARPLRRGPEKQSASSPNSAARSANSALRTAAALGGVVGLILLLAWGYRAVAGGSGRLPLSLRSKRPALIEVLSRTPLSPRQTLCLVRIGPRLVLLGVSADAVRPLDVIHDPDLTAQLVGQAAQHHADSSTAEFARCLEREARAYPATGDGLDETAAPADEPLRDLKHKLAGTIARLRATAVRG
jgi:flagellar biogenesis protein FliO